MFDDSLIARARSLWQTLAAVPAVFPSDGGLHVVASPASRLCPPSWVGIVVLGDSAIATVPTEQAVQPVERAMSAVATESLTSPEVLEAALPVKEVLGPATLAYVSRDTFVPNRSDVAVERLAPGHPDLRALLKSVGAEDADESGIGEITSPAFVVRERGSIAAAAGYGLWPAATAHLCVLTAETARGRGLAKRVAAAAVDHALSARLLPQWRARPAASLRVARALGFCELGTQLSVDVALARLADPDRTTLRGTERTAEAAWHRSAGQKSACSGPGLSLGSRHGDTSGGRRRSRGRPESARVGIRGKRTEGRGLERGVAGDERRAFARRCGRPTGRRACDVHDQPARRYRANSSRCRYSAPSACCPSATARASDRRAHPSRDWRSWTRRRVRRWCSSKATLGFYSKGRLQSGLANSASASRRCASPMPRSRCTRLRRTRTG